MRESDQSDSAGGRWRGFWRSPVFTAVLALLLVLALGLVFSGEGAFFKWATHRDMLRQASVYGILACGMTLVIIAAGIDLSVGSVLALCAVCFAIFAIQRGWPAWQAILAVLLIGTAAGLLSGALIARFSIQPFVVTLAMMVFARGLAKYVSGGMKVSTAVRTADGGYSYVAVPPVVEAL